jgi:CheY-like chemotaxis protein
MTLLIPPPHHTDDGGPQAWRPRSDADLLAAQLDAIAHWHRLTGGRERSLRGQSRESRLDAARRRDIADREHAALLAWADRGLDVEFIPGHGAVPRAVVAHRNDWLRTKVTASFRERGVDVVASTDDGAQAVAAVVIEQPDVVFVEDLLPTLSGLEVIQRTRALAPDALIGAHALGQSGMPPLLDAGARATFSRRIPPAEIVAELVACLHGSRTALTVV